MTSQDQIIGVLEDTANLIRKFQINLKKCPKDRLTKGYIETRMKCIDEYWDTFKSIHNELLRATPREQRTLLPYLVNEDFYIYEDLYLCIKGDLTDLLTTKSTTKSVQSTEGDVTMEPQLSGVKLPRIQLPTFSGNYEEWPTFQDMYVSLVHNSTRLMNVQKLHYLKTSITGEAAVLLKHIQVTDSNYLQAWDILKNRYNNKRLIVNSLLKRLFTQRKPTTQSPVHLKSLLDTTTECINSLQNLNVNTDSWDPVLIFLIVQKLDPESHKEWEEYAHKDDYNELPMWSDLKKFLESKFRTLELITPTSFTHQRNNNSYNINKNIKSLHASIDRACVMCKENHYLCHCKEFIKLEPFERSEFVKHNRICFNCLIPGHSVNKCRVTMSCRICHKRHHSLLHRTKNAETSVNQEPIQTTPSASSRVEEMPVTTMVASHHSSGQDIALLATALVTIQDMQGKSIVVRALIDLGSQASFISEKATQMLRLKKLPVNQEVTGIESTRISVKQAVKLQVLSRQGNNNGFEIHAYVMSKQLCHRIPTNTVALNQWPHLEGLTLADPSYCFSGPIDLLLGVREYAKILQQGLITGPPGTPCAQNTSLGWIIFGEINTYTNHEDYTISVMHQQLDMDTLLKTIWEIDTDTKRTFTKEEQTCEEFYKRTHTRNTEGRYIVNLPFNTDKPRSPYGNTKDIAIQRFLQLEKRFAKMPKLKEDYIKVMEEYKNLQHMEEVPTEEINNEKAVYLPHHAVIREDKETTKTRVVFDASCKGTNGISLNEELLLGPTLQDDLRSLIMRWRTHAICFVADIQKMYRMILVAKEDSDYQRILWRKDPSEDLKEYRLLTVTFGTGPAPYLAVKTLMQLASDEGDKYPTAARILQNDFYVDDCLSGSSCLQEAVHASKELKKLLKCGGFDLKKWSSNSVEFMQTIDEAERSSNARLDFNIDGKVKALGILWDLKNDQFHYNVTLQEDCIYTKRGILSDIQKLFDPLGWIAPYIVMTKILIQRLWLERAGWDEEIRLPIKEEWNKIRTDLKNVANVQIDRWLNTSNAEMETVEIHGFCDASMQAYAGVVYCRVMKPDGAVIIKLIAARTRVAPLKTVSLPRLELCGAVLLVRLLKQIAKALNVPSHKIYAWTDSTIVISWICGEPNRWKTFVANRVVEIVETVNSNQWNHVQSHENPADVASRGMLVSDLAKCDLWWRGPTWLYEKDIQFTKPDIIPTELEKKRNITTYIITENKDKENELHEKFERFDTLLELLRVLTFCHRFLHLKGLKEDIDSVITPHELDNALNICIKAVQLKEFEKEIVIFKGGKQVMKTSKLKFFNPFLDEKKILRVGGRLRHANLDESSKHPIILGNNNTLIGLIIADAHRKTLHGGVQLMLCFLRSKYCILRAKSLVKKHIHKCLICAKQSATARTQVMGDLPKVRVTPSRPFSHSGVDFAGPFYVTMSKGRGIRATKAYISIFICMSSKAIHLELVGDMTSAAFIGAFRRFCARRGKCTHLYSDQGRNFVGANKELTTAWNEACLQFTGDIAESLASDGTTWHFIPAYSPNFGGLWEAGVKSIKFHLKRILTTNLTYEEMSTLLCEIEACLNSRPLCPIEDDTDNIEPLTPGHFLIGEAPVVIPNPNLENIKIHSLSRWQYTRKLLDNFWHRWQVEYLSRLQQRPKWLKNKKDFDIGDIILIKSDYLPPGKWALGRVIEKHPGPDGFTRVYSIKSGDGIIKRSVSKLCPLPIETD